MKSIRDFDLTGYNTFGMKVKCNMFIEYDSLEELSSLPFDTLPQPVISLGGGANVLFTSDFKGTVLHSNIKYIKYFDLGVDRVPVSAGSGVVFDDLVRKTCEDGLWGLENLSAIPGSVGGCAVQNVGAYGAEMADCISGITCFDTLERKKCSFKATECGFGYRDSIFKKEENKGRYIISGVLLQVSRRKAPKLSYKGLENVRADRPSDVREAVMRIREAKLPDPKVIGSAGSFFKNPVVDASVFSSVIDAARALQGEDAVVPHYILNGGFVKIPAAYLIDSCGFKGAVRGGAGVYEKQPLVLVNRSGDALPSDIIGLENEIIEKVNTTFGIRLCPEVEHI